MKLALLGATGGTGRHILDLASSRGHLVTALVRTPSKLNTAPVSARIIEGDACDPGVINELVRGQDAVVSALGVTSRTATTLYSDSARLVLDAMKRQSVPHFIAITAGTIVHDQAWPTLFRYLLQPILLRVFAGTYEDMKRLEEIVQNSDRSWTLVRPSGLTNGALQDNYRVSEHPLPRGWTVSRADLAHFVVRCAEESALRDKALFVAY